MGDRCFMSVTCRREDRAHFEELGFQAAYGENKNAPVIELIDEEANYAHYHELPTDIPYLAWNGAGCDYGDGKVVCDGKQVIEVSTNHDGSFCVDWNIRWNLPVWKDIRHIRRYLKLATKVEKLFERLRNSDKPTMQPLT